MKIAKGLKLIKKSDKAKCFSFEKTSFWIPNTAIVDIKLTANGYDVVVSEWFKANSFFKETSLSELLQEIPPVNVNWITGINENEFPSDLAEIQKQAVAFTTSVKRALVWLWTGCGKTKIGIETANILHKHGKIKRIYWITPQYERALAQIQNSFERWLNKDIEVKIVSINWFSYNTDFGINENDCVIIDEVHRVKNGIDINNFADCELAKNIRYSIEKAGFVYGLTATSCINGATDLFGIFFCLDKKIIIEKGKKPKDYLNVKGEKINGIKSMLSFIQSVAPYIFHKKKSDYDARSPQINTHKLNLTQAQSIAMNKLYERSNAFRRNESIVDVYSAMIKCSYISGGAQIKTLKMNEILKSIPKEDQVIVFGFTVSGKYSDISVARSGLIDLGIDFIELHGEQNEKDNALSVHLFKQGKYRVLLASFGCGAELLDFPNANHVILFGQSLNPIHRFQAIGRIDRLTQKKQCHIHNVYINNSVEGYINNLYERKIDMSDNISFYISNNEKTLNNEIS